EYKSVSKFLKGEKALVKSIVANLTIKRLPTNVTPLLYCFQLNLAAIYYSQRQSHLIWPIWAIAYFAFYRNTSKYIFLKITMPSYAHESI
ncbi:MAG: hypothetical protein WCF97_01075, partial [Nitrososphaeraceae archaeon]